MELLDVYDDYGNKTGKTVIRGDKSIILLPNEHIALAVIFIENSNGEFLIQKRSPQKDGKYCSTGGHVDSGETIKEAIIREVKEELGLDISQENLIDLGYLLYDKPIRYLYYLQKDVDISSLNIQKEEVDFAEYMGKDKIEELINQNELLESHAIMYQRILEYKKEKK